MLHSAGNTSPGRIQREPLMSLRDQVLEEIARLNKVLALLDGEESSKGTAKKGTKRKAMSAAARKKISMAQKKRWREQKKKPTAS
jgi:hypothetical protein